MFRIHFFTTRDAVIRFVIILGLAGLNMGLVNPSLQPMLLFDRYDNILLVKIAQSSPEHDTARLECVECIKGKWEAKEVVAIIGPDAKAKEVFSQHSRPGSTLVALTGSRSGRRTSNDMLLYLGGGRWMKGVVTENKLDEWTLQEDTGEAYFGCFNGDAERLAEMARDAKQGKYYFPAKPFTRFKPDTILGKLPGDGRGIALYDIDGDGRLDVYACSTAGDRVFMQIAPLRFEDRTSAMGLEKSTSTSISIADANADGHADLLAGGKLYIADGKGCFSDGAVLPELLPAQVKHAGFLEANGDGYPDVLASIQSGGLRLFLNSGKLPTTFREVSKEAGLRSEDCLPESSGFVSWGDWNQDGRADLFFAAGRGLILTQDDQGGFAPVKSFASYNFDSMEGEEGASGGSSFAALWQANRIDMVSANDNLLFLLTNHQGQIVDRTNDANEITEHSSRQIAVIAEDLNADGTLDLYTLSRKANNMLHSNRGYGSFMADTKYDKSVFSGAAHSQGAWGAATGDVDGDGTNDLVLCGNDGTVSLLLNDCLSLRKQSENPLYHDKVRLQARYLTVGVRGKTGVCGAEIIVRDASKNMIARRSIGGNVATGCRGPDQATLALLFPGVYGVTVRFSDATEQTQSVDLTSEVRASITLTPEPKK